MEKKSLKSNTVNVLIIDGKDSILSELEKISKITELRNIIITRNLEDISTILRKESIKIIICNTTIFIDTKTEEILSYIQKEFLLSVLFISPSMQVPIYKKLSRLNFIGHLITPCRADEIEVLIRLSIYKLGIKKRTKNNQVFIKDIKFIKKENRLFYKNIEVLLTKKERLLLSLLFEKLFATISYDVIDNYVWNEEVSVNTRRTLVYRMKKKFPYLIFKIEKNIGISLFI